MTLSILCEPCSQAMLEWTGDEARSITCKCLAMLQIHYYLLLGNVIGGSMCINQNLNFFSICLPIMDVMSTIERLCKSTQEDHDVIK